jgi:hypothetical protein
MFDLTSYENPLLVLVPPELKLGKDFIIFV